jgi:hypothetical protein
VIRSWQRAERSAAPSLAYVVLILLVASGAAAQTAAPVSPAPVASGAASVYDGAWKGTSSESGAACPAFKFSLVIAAGAISGHAVLPIAVHENHLFNLGSEDTNWDVSGAILDDGTVSFITTTADKDVDPKRRSIKFAGSATADTLQLKQGEPSMCGRSLTLTRSKPK